jgi:hypothetical protein
MRNTEKGFQNISFAAGEIFQKDLAARGMACGDLNNDGNIDIVIAQTDGAAVVLRNNGGTKNRWIGIDLRGSVSAPNGEGSRIIVTDANGRKQVFDVTNSGSYLSANDPRILVGLGEAESVKSIEIRWTSGEAQLLENPAVNQYHLIKEK